MVGTDTACSYDRTRTRLSNPRCGGSREPEAVRREGVPDHPRRACRCECLLTPEALPRSPPLCHPLKRLPLP